jgi:asparagine synthase (glutamine-hydrolysing)
MGAIGKPSHFIGYWGQTDLTKTLSRLVPDYCIRQGKLSEWAIASESVLAGDTVTLNACGRFGPTDLPSDAWAQVEAGQLRLGRDPFGRVPLYWMRSQETIWFSTQMQLLLPLIDSPQVSPIALHSYACFSYVPTPLTAIEQIASVAAGTEMIWEIPDAKAVPKVQSLQSAWQEAPQLLRSEDEAIAQLQVLLQQAIDRQVADLPIDEPVGVLLSGGIDSSLVTALLVKAGLQVRAYALDFGVESYSELPYAQQVADFLQIPLIRVAATGDAILRAIGPTAKALDIPYGDGTTAALFLLKQAAAQDVRVVFNGENGDQLFAGWTNKPLIANGVYSAEHPAGKETFEQQYLRTFQRFYGYEKLIFSPEMLDRIQAHDLSVYLQDAIGCRNLSLFAGETAARFADAQRRTKYSAEGNGIGVCLRAVGAIALL